MKPYPPYVPFKPETDPTKWFGRDWAVCRLLDGLRRGYNCRFPKGHNGRCEFPIGFPVTSREQRRVRQ